jgi:hypothetical protein
MIFTQSQMETEECHKKFTEKIENEDKPWGVGIPS